MINKIRNLFNKFKKNTNVENEFDGSEEIDLPEIPTDENFDQTDSYNEDVLDIDDGKLSFKDRLNLVLENIKNKVGRIHIKKPKKLSVNKSIEDITGKIKLPKVLANKGVKVKKINWSNIHNDFFHPSKRQSFHRIFQYSVVILITFTLGKSLGIILTGSKDYKGLPKNTSLDIDKSSLLKREHVTQIKKAKLFKTEAKKVEDGNKKPKVNTNLACIKADGKSRLPIKLINTIVLQDSVKSIASVQVRSANLLQELRVGEKIDNMAKIDKIERSKLIIKNLRSGTCESIENIDSKNDYTPIAVMSPKQSKSFKKQRKKIKGIENSGNDFVIEKSFMKQKMSNISDILTQARGIQINNPDGSISFKIVDVQPGGIFAHLGIENNDVITQINGQPINDLNAVMSLFGKITNIDKLGLTLKRGGVETPQNYKFK